MRSGLSYSVLKKMKKKVMSDHLQQSLFTDFEYCFRPATTKTGTVLSRCSIDCGDGWESIVRNMCSVIENRPPTVLRKKSLLTGVLSAMDYLSRKVEAFLQLKPHKLYTFKPKEHLDFPGFYVRFDKIKEKYGKLEISYTVVSKLSRQDFSNFNKKDVLHELTEYRGFAAGVVAAAENLSLVTCENDGDSGELYTKGWWKTLCPSCAKKTNEL